MPRKQRSAKRQEKSSFLTPDFLRKQKMSLEDKLANFRRLQEAAREAVKVPASDERRGDVPEQALTYSERRIAAQQLEVCGKIASQVIRALDSVDNLLGRKKKSGEKYGVCPDCEESIPQKRLEIIPWAERCTPCQEKKDAPVLS